MAEISNDMSRTRKRIAWTYLIPAIFVVTLFSVIPVLYALNLSLHQNVLTRPGHHPFTGLKNFIDVLSGPRIAGTIVVTLRFTAISMVFTSVFGVLIALLMNQRFMGAKVLQVLILLPWAVPVVIAGVVWRWMFAGNIGLINGFLYALGIIEDYYSFFGNPVTAEGAIVVARIWKDLPLASIMLLAALQTIPHELYENIKIDGGGAWVSFRHVTFPFLRPTLTVVLVLVMLLAFATFDLVFVMTGGGPAGATTLVAWFIYTEMFTNLNLGRGAALAFVMAILTLLIAAGLYRALRTDDFYD